MNELLQLPLADRLSLIETYLVNQSEKRIGANQEDIIFRDSPFMDDAHCAPNKIYRSSEISKTQNNS